MKLADLWHVDILSVGNNGSLNQLSGSSSLSSEEIVMMFGGDYLVSDRENTTIFDSLYIGESRLALILVFSSRSTKERSVSFLDNRGE